MLARGSLIPLFSLCISGMILANRCAAMFEGRDDICVPPVVRDQTTERVLTMHFEQVGKATPRG